MPVRTGRLFRLCEKCNQPFQPTGKYNKFCIRCSGRNRFINRMAKLQKKVNKK